MADPRIIQTEDLQVDQTEPVHRTRNSQFFQGDCHSTPVLVELPTQELHWGDDDFLAFRQELERRTNLSHPNLCLLLGACVHPQVAIVLERTKGNIAQDLPTTKVPLFKRLIWAKEAAQGISWLHGAEDPVIVEDLKLTNLYYDDVGKVKVYAWSPFTTLADRNNLPPDCLIYLAPEIMLGQESTTKSDSYSFGLLLFELLTKEAPYRGYATLVDIIQDICMQHVRPVIPENCNATLRELITQCWHPDPNARPSFTQITELLETEVIPSCENQFYINRIHSMIEDPNARNFWELFFFTDAEALWDNFRAVFFPVRSNYEPNIRNQDQRTPRSLANPLPNIPTASQLAEATTEQLEELANRNRVGKSIVAKALQARKNTGYIAQASATEEEMVRRILCPGTQNVTLANFAAMVGWFAPLDDDFLTRMRDTITNPYFQGKLSFDQANGLLQTYMGPNRRPCLVRFSGNRKNTFNICYVTAEPQIKHLPVPYRSGQGFLFQGQYYSTMAELMLQAQEQLLFNSTCGECPFIQFAEDDYYMDE